MSTSTAANRQQSKPTLFTLPLEIRDIIWFYALQDPYYDPDDRNPAHPSALQPNGVLVESHKTLSWTYSEPYWGQSTMTYPLLINKQASHEAAHILYTQFNFHFECNVLSELCDAFFAFSTPAKKSLRTISIHKILTDVSHPLYPSRSTGRRRNQAAEHSDQQLSLSLLVQRLPGLQTLHFYPHFSHWECIRNVSAFDAREDATRVVVDVAASFIKAAQHVNSAVVVVPVLILGEHARKQEIAEAFQLQFGSVQVL